MPSVFIPLVKWSSLLLQSFLSLWIWVNYRFLSSVNTGWLALTSRKLLAYLQGAWTYNDISTFMQTWLLFIVNKWKHVPSFIPASGNFMSLVVNFSTAFVQTWNVYARCGTRGVQSRNNIMNGNVGGGSESTPSLWKRLLKPRLTWSQLFPLNLTSGTCL